MVVCGCFIKGVDALPPKMSLKNTTGSVKPVPSSLRLSAQVSEMAVMCNAVGIALDNRKIPGIVTRVRPGTAAAYSGLLEGDRIVSAHWDENSMTIDFNRLGAHYTVNLEVRMKEVRANWDEQIRQAAAKEDAPPLTANQANQTNPAKQTTLSSSAERSQTPDAVKFFKALSPYKIILLIDHSGSMNGGLGIGPIDISRWGWCRNQITDFSRFCGDRLKGGVTLIPFNDSYEVKEHASNKNLEELFNEIVPSGQTDIYTPLSYAIQSHLADPDHRNKPVLIVVLTDGLPNQGGSLDQLIAHATNTLQENDEMIITFLTIGQDPEGDELIEHLDKNLVSGGAKEDIVDSMPFSRLLEIGLKNALLDTVTKVRSRH